MCKTIFQIRTSIKQLLQKMSIFHKIALSFTYSQKQINCLTNMMVGTCKESTFSSLPVVSCEVFVCRGAWVGWGWGCCLLRKHQILCLKKNLQTFFLNMLISKLDNHLAIIIHGLTCLSKSVIIADQTSNFVIPHVWRKQR